MQGYSNVLFNTSNKTGNKFSLTLEIKDFSYTFAIENLFNGLNAVTIMALVTLSGSLVITSAPNMVEHYAFDNVKYNISSLINMSSSSLPDTGGLIGFFSDISLSPNDSLTTLTNCLVSFNSNTTAEQIKIWNSFSTNTTSSATIIAELKKADVLYNFIMNNIDLTNPFGMGTFPTVVDNTLKTNINTAVSSLTTADLSFVNPGVAAITLANVANDSTVQGSGTFTSIKIYFGYENDSIGNMNITSATITFQTFHLIKC